MDMKNISLNTGNLLQRAWRFAAAGALFVTVPGLLIGKIIPWYHENLYFRFWLATAILGIGSIVILVKLFTWKNPVRPAGVSWGIWPWCTSLFSALFFFAAGYVLTCYFWWSTG